MTASFPVVEESALRSSLADDISVCEQCRLCVDLCDVFPSIFDALAHVADADPHLLTPQQQNVISDSCFHCGACTQRCPHRGPSSEYDIDLPSSFIDLMHVRQLNGYFSIRQRMTNWVLSSPDLIGPLLSQCSPFVNWLMQQPNTLRRRFVTAITGISSSARVPLVSGERFSKWFRRQELPATSDRSQVSVFPTCIVEYFSDETARAVVDEIASHGRTCHLSTTRCCGAEELRSGRVRAFRKRVGRLVKLLEKDSSTDPIIVMSPSCLAHLRTNLVLHCEADQITRAESVVSRLRSPLEVLAEVSTSSADVTFSSIDSAHRQSVLFLPSPYEGHAERATFEGRVGVGATAQIIEDAGLQMGAWALRQGNEESARRIVQRMARRLPPSVTSPHPVARSGHLSSQALRDETSLDIVDPTLAPREIPGVEQ